jgi:hypothetical protein
MNRLELRRETFEIKSPPLVENRRDIFERRAIPLRIAVPVDDELNPIPMAKPPEDNDRRPVRLGKTERLAQDHPRSSGPAWLGLAGRSVAPIAVVSNICSVVNGRQLHPR